MGKGIKAFSLKVKILKKVMFYNTFWHIYVTQTLGVGYKSLNLIVRLYWWCLTIKRGGRKAGISKDPNIKFGENIFHHFYIQMILAKGGI